MKKVPAVGNYQPSNSIQKNSDQTISFKQKNIFPKYSDSVCRVEKNVVVEKVKSKAKVKSQKSISVFHEIHTKNKFTKNIPVFEKKFSEQKDHHRLIIFLLILLGLALIGYGIFFISIVLFGATWYLLFLGVALILLGLLPFAGILSMVVGDRHVPNGNYKESQGKQLRND